MKIESNRVVRFHYALSDAGGTPIESSEGSEPIAALIGHNNIIPGLEAALLGHEAGAQVTAEVPPEQAYGQPDPGLMQRLPKKYFKDAAKLKPGMQTTLQTRQGPRPVTVRKLGMSVIDVDLNHPLAGRNLRFVVDIVDVREASAEEIAHRHAHGTGGHQHG
jgi:FKBP-type peptidyl-prolyl cis-trans isomerase SlyD